MPAGRSFKELSRVVLEEMVLEVEREGVKDIGVSMAMV